MSLLNKIPDKMSAQCNVLDLAMISISSIKSNGTLIILQKYCWTILRVAKFKKKITKPRSFRCGIARSNNFGFARRKCG